MENIIIESNQNKIIKEVNSLKAKKKEIKPVFLYSRAKDL